MLRNLLVLFLILFILPSPEGRAQYGTTKGLILLTGEILNEDGVTPLADVHIYNHDT